MTVNFLFRNKYFGIIATLTLASFGVLSRILDRNENGNWVFWQKAYLPDGYNYIIQAIRLSHSEYKFEFLDRVREFFPGAPQDMMKLSEAVQSTLDARPIYPYLTSLLLDLNFEVAPLVFPLLCWILLNVFVYLNTRRNHGALYALLVVVMLSGSFYMRLNFIGTTTDALAAFFCYSAFYFLLARNLNHRATFAAYFFVILAIFSRPLDPIFIVAVIGLILFGSNKILVFRKLALLVFVLVAHLVYIQLNFGQLQTGSINTGGDQSGGLFHFLIVALFEMPKIILVEFGFIIVHDSLLFMLVLWSILVLVRDRNKVLITQFVLIFLSTFYLSALNGTIGSGFRYQLPIVMFCLVIISKGRSVIPARIEKFRS